MSFYGRVIFPHVCDYVMGNKPMSRERRDLLGAASGVVLEIGFGTGRNLPYYPKSVERLVAVDVNP